jgi:hypothetical protein
MNRSRGLITIAVLGTSLLVAACNEKGMSYGDPNSIIAVMPADIWGEVDDEVYAELERTVLTVSEEKTFTVTYQEPYAEFWDRLRRFQQMFVVGTQDDAWVQEILAQASTPVTDTGLHQVHDVWSRGQNVTLLLLDEGWGPEELRPYLAEVHGLLDRQYRAYAMNRMYFSGVDSALADTLALEAGFSMLYPSVYRWTRQDSVYLFRNDNPDPAELIRQVSVTWRTPAPGIVDRELMETWRSEVVASSYSEPQEWLGESSSERSFEHDGNPTVEIRAQWRNPPERGWPAGGPIIVRAITCEAQDRTYLIDAWLYAPGKEKYEYMIQLETLLDSFRCIV